MSAIIRKFYRGTTGPIDGTVLANVVLDTQTIEVSLDRTTWIAGEWQGTAGTAREFTFPVADLNLPASNGNYPVWVRITGPGYSVIEKAGTLQVL